VFAVANSRNAGCGSIHAALIEQRQPPFDFEHALNDEHHVGAAGVVFIEHQRARTLQRPRQHARLELGDLLAVADDDRVLADQIHAADVPIEVDAHARPVETRCHLLDVTRLPRAMPALHHHPAVVQKPGEQRQRGIAIEDVVGIASRHMFFGGRERRHLQIAVYLEYLARGDLDVGKIASTEGNHGGQVIGPGRHESVDYPRSVCPSQCFDRRSVQLNRRSIRPSIIRPSIRQLGSRPAARRRRTRGSHPQIGAP
jgi:hypothetical protein